MTRDVANLTTEHRQIEAVRAEAADGPPADATWPMRLLDTLRVLRDHILAAQDGVFPAALTRLATEDWAAVDALRAASSRALRGARE